MRTHLPAKTRVLVIIQMPAVNLATTHMTSLKSTCNLPRLSCPRVPLLTCLNSSLLTLFPLIQPVRAYLRPIWTPLILHLPRIVLLHIQNKPRVITLLILLTILLALLRATLPPLLLMLMLMLLQPTLLLRIRPDINPPLLIILTIS